MYDGEERRENWYTNKDLFEMIQVLTKSLGDMSRELELTRSAIKEYNGLRQCLNDVTARVIILEQKRLIMSMVRKGAMEWGGWIIATILGLIALAKYIIPFFAGG